jgi:2-polyprenyl-3-methyl-5-hydroxy-6-metoxy-1,4-benzoquinol methylase
MSFVGVPEDLLRRVVAHLPSERVNETAVPSYTHANPLIRWLFRKRLDTALELARIQRRERVLDFGTGSGILLASLAGVAGQVAATDLDVTPARQLVTTLGLAVEVVGPDDFSAWTASHAGQLDVVMALDVFEHFTAEELETVSARLRGLLAPGGRLVVSGPTESLAYQIGRRIAGFTNTYHYRSVYDIDAQLRRHWQSQAARFIPLVPRAFLLTSYVPRS